MNIRPALAFALAAFAAHAVANETERTTEYPIPEGKLIVHSGQPAATGPFAVPQSVAELDQDGDGAISRAEARANDALTNEFDHADLNRDGRISASELSRWH